MQKLTFKEQFSLWSKVAAQSFGGPAGQMAVIHKLVVEEKKILSEKRFLHALNFCMLLPGPEAQQLATYMGWLINGWRGGLIAGGLFILPGFLSILFLSYLYILYQDTALITGLFYGMKPAVIAIVLAALIKISKKSLKSGFYWALAILAFLSLFLFNLPFPYVVLGSGLLGILHSFFNKQVSEFSPEKAGTPSFMTLFKTVLIWGGVWILPLLLVYFTFGSHSSFHQINLFFSKMSMVTFGGAYAALSYVAQEGVETYQWLKSNEMIDGLAMAETTPGPLIQVVQYVGFMGAYRFPGALNPYFSAFIGSVLTTWMTFAPCFLWIFSFAPFIEYVRSKKIFYHALNAITSSIVGVIANLSLWFMINSLFKKTINIQSPYYHLQLPLINSFDAFAIGICLVALFMQFYLKKSIFLILGACTALGVLGQFIMN